MHYIGTLIKEQRGSRKIKNTLLCAVATCFVIAPALGQSVEDQFDFNIQGGTLERVVESVREITDAEFLYSFDLVNIDGLNPVYGKYTVDEALAIMLQGTGLSGGLTERGMIVITRDSGAQASVGENTDVNKKLKNSLLAGTIAAMTSLGQQQAYAQDSAEVVEAAQDDTKTLDTIVISGIRASLEQAVSLKRNSSVISDVISATDLGRFPDENVAESLQRITGVQIQKLRGEGAQVSIRGLTPIFTNTTLNGHGVASAFNLGYATRSFEFGTLPSEFVNTLEVYKTPTASIAEGGLAGTVIVRTPRPLDVGRRQIALSAQGAYESNSGEIAPRVSGIYTDTFADGKFGVTLGAAFTQRNSETQSAIARGFRRSREGVQNLIIFDKFEEEKERSSFLGTLEWRPTGNSRFFVDGFHTDLVIDAPRSAAEFYFGNSPARADSIEDTDFTLREEINGDLLATRFGATNQEYRAASRYEYREGDTTSFSTGGSIDLDAWTLKGEVSFSDSFQTFDNLNIATQSILPYAAYDVTVDSEVPSLILPADTISYMNNPENHRILSVNGDFGSTIKDEILEVKFDVERELNLAFPGTFKFGAAVTEREQVGTPSRLVVSGPKFAALEGLPTLTNFPGVPNAVSAARYIEIFGSGNGGFLESYDGAATFPSVFPRSATASYLDTTDRGTLSAAGTVTVDETAAIDVVEKATALYAQFDFASVDDVFRGNLGVRYVNTDQESTGVAPNLADIVILPNSGGIVNIPAAAPVSVSRAYDDILPSANLSINVTDDVVARFAASRTMARPNLEQISPSTTAGQSPPSINSQNPNLDPFRSNNFDFAVEWYFDDDAILSATLFYKDIVSLVSSDQRLENLRVTADLGDGTSEIRDQEFIFRSLVNSEGATLKGAEFSYQDGFDFLPGIWSNTGVLFNYTYLDNSKPEEIVGSSSHNINAGGYYEGDNISLRMSYTWRDKYLLINGAQEGDGLFVEAGGALDGNITYDFNENFSIVVEGTNLLDTPVSMTDGNGYPAIFEDNGRRVLFGARAKF